MSNLKQVVYLTEAQYESLLAGNTVGRLTGIDPDALYVTDQTVSMTDLTGILPVSKGGTGLGTLTSGYALIGNGTNNVSLRGIRNNTSKGTLGWTSASTDNTLITTNTLAYWDGSYSGTSSNITRLGTIASGTWQGSVIGASYGGTGQNTLNKSANALINALDTGASDLSANDYVITQYVGGGTTTTTYHRRPANKVINATLVKAALGTDSSTTNQWLNKAGNWSTPTAAQVGAVSSITPGNGLINGTSGTSQSAITSSGTISIKDGGVTNAMLAGSIANNKLSNSSISIAGNSVSLGGSVTADTLRTSLGLSNAMHFRGIATTVIDDSTNNRANPTISGYTFGTNGANALAGDVVIDKDNNYEYVWSADGTNGRWEKLGGDSSYALSGHTHYYLKTIGDYRSDNTSPNDYSAQIIFQGLKYNNQINSPITQTEATYSYLVGLRGWGDSSGGDSHELAFNNKGIYWRQGASSWDNWQQIITTKSFPSENSPYYYKYSQTYTNSTTPSTDWFIKITLDRTYQSDLTPIIIFADYSNINGKLYLHLDGYSQYFKAYRTSYNHSNILSIKFTTTSGKSILYLKFKQPVAYNNTTPKGAFTIYSPVSITSIESTTDPGNMIKLKDGYTSNTAVAADQMYATTFNGNATKATSANITSTAYGVAYYSNTTGTFASTSAGTSGYLLQGNGSAAPSWIQATNSNTASTIVKRDSSGNFSAGTITATLNGNASTASLLKPKDSTTTASASTWNIPSGSKQVWGQKFTDSSLTYTPEGGSATTVTDSGDWTMWLTPNATSNLATLNMRIDGDWYATTFRGSGAGLTSIPAGQLTGNIADARLSSNIPRKDASVAFTDTTNVTDGSSTGRYGTLVVSGGIHIDKSLKIGKYTNRSTAIGEGIRIHDLRDITDNADKFGDYAVNWYFDQVNGYWTSIMSMKGWSGNYYAWELAGNANNTKIDKYYVRTMLGTTAGTWHTLVYLPAFAAKGSGTKGIYVDADGCVQEMSYTLAANVPSDAVFTDTNKYHKTGSWNGLTYTATAVNSAEALAFTIPTGTTSTTVAVGNHNHDSTYVPMTTGANDVNTIVNTGIYKITSGSATNTPRGYKFGQLIVLAYRNHTGNTTTDYASQIYIHGAGGETGSAANPGNTLYYRASGSSTSNTWYSWQKAVHADDTYTKVGSTTKGVYVDESGKVQEMTYSISKDVPSDAVFTDTKNTAGSTNSASKLYLIGATSHGSAATQTYSYQYTYTNNGLLSATKLGLNASGTEKVHMEWNATDLSLDFIFD